MTFCLPFQMSPDNRFPSPGGGFPPAAAAVAAIPSSDPYSQHPDHDPMSTGQVIMSNCKRPGCPNPVRMMSNRPMPEYCSNDCLVSENNKQMTNNPYANATNNWQQQQQQQPDQGSSPASNHGEK